MKWSLGYMLAVAVLLLCGCRDNSYRGQWDEYDGDPDSKHFYPVWISIGPYYTLPTKAGGGEDPRDILRWREKNIYIYAFGADSTKNISYMTNSSYDEEQCLIDGSKDGDFLGGKLGKRGEDDVLLYWPSGVSRTVNYPRNLNTYQFFGYIIDDAQMGQIERSDDKVVIPITIDGAQDVMTAYSDPMVTYNELGSEYTQEDKEEILKYSYSEYTAKNNVYPQLLFKHHMTKFKFDVIAGQREDKEIIRITNIRIYSKNMANLTVADKDVENVGISFIDGKEGLLELREADGAPLDPNFYFVNTHVPDTMRVGDALYAAPQVKYVAEVAVTEDVSKHTYINTIPLMTKDGKFEPGAVYQVTFTLYGMMDVRVDVDMLGWIDGGNIDIDTELKPN